MERRILTSGSTAHPWLQERYAANADIDRLMVRLGPQQNSLVTLIMRERKRYEAWLADCYGRGAMSDGMGV